MVIDVKYIVKKGEVTYMCKDPNIKGLFCSGATPEEMYDNLERMRKYARENGFV